MVQPLFHFRSDDRSRPVAFRSFPVPACAPTVRARRQERQVQGGGSEELGSRHWVRGRGWSLILCQFTRAPRPSLWSMCSYSQESIVLHRTIKHQYIYRYIHIRVAELSVQKIVCSNRIIRSANVATMVHCASSCEGKLHSKHVRKNYKFNLYIETNIRKRSLM